MNNLKKAKKEFKELKNTCNYLETINETINNMDCTTLKHHIIFKGFVSGVVLNKLISVCDNNKLIYFVCSDGFVVHCR